MSEMTHEVVLVEGAMTKNGSAYVRCTTKDGQRVNAFGKGRGLDLFEDAGYVFDDLTDGKRQVWKTHPIGVHLILTGAWWELFDVATKPEGAAPDVEYVPNLAWYREKAINEARKALQRAVWFDTETTGVDAQAEIISIAILDYLGEEWRSFVRPINLDAVAATTHIHGITAEELIGAPSFAEIYEDLDDLMPSWYEWAGYNVGFDARMIEQACMQHGLNAFLCPMLVDVMLIYSQFAGLWDAERQRWGQVKLREACEVCGIELLDAHDALADIRATRELARYIAYHATQDETP